MCACIRVCVCAVCACVWLVCAYISSLFYTLQDPLKQDQLKRLAVGVWARVGYRCVSTVHTYVPVFINVIRMFPSDRYAAIESAHNFAT